MKFDVQSRLGERARYFRRRRAITQEQLAERCGFTAKYISHVERGVVNVPLMTLAAIAKALEVTMSELTVGIDGALPHVARESAEIYAGRPRAEQAAIGRLLVAIDDLIKETKGSN
jgi:transcriptional regulator with XRE-family HTH domain